MGFSVIAANVILGIALVTAGGALSATYWDVTGDLEQARRVQASLAEDRLRTSIRVTGTPSWTAILNLYSFDVRNDGTTTLRVDEVSFLLDGRHHSRILLRAVNADPLTNLWLPGETLHVELREVESAPVLLFVVAGNGVAAQHPR